MTKSIAHMGWRGDEMEIDESRSDVSYAHIGILQLGTLYVTILDSLTAVNESRNGSAYSV